MRGFLPKRNRVSLHGENKIRWVMQIRLYIIWYVCHWSPIRIRLCPQPYFRDRNNLSVVDSLVVGLIDIFLLKQENFSDDLGYSVFNKNE